MQTYNGSTGESLPSRLLEGTSRPKAPSSRRRPRGRTALRFHRDVAAPCHVAAHVGNKHFEHNPVSYKHEGRISYKNSPHGDVRVRICETPFYDLGFFQAQSNNPDVSQPEGQPDVRTSCPLI